MLPEVVNVVKVEFLRQAVDENGEPTGAYEEVDNIPFYVPATGSGMGVVVSPEPSAEHRYTLKFPTEGLDPASADVLQISFRLVDATDLEETGPSTLEFTSADGAVKIRLISQPTWDSE
jgi:hypothetical protein